MKETLTRAFLRIKKPRFVVIVEKTVLDEVRVYAYSRAEAKRKAEELLYSLGWEEWKAKTAWEIKK